MCSDTMLAVSLSFYRDIWHKSLQHMRFISRQPDIRHKCEVLQQDVGNAKDEEQKFTAGEMLATHTWAVQRKQEFD